ncbi:hypothetical protein EOD42_22555 [Rhodovarius crocodyli]|uniref:Uncharacterized protein n=1 Tax=Rhodovarius crocodyli TaxID=1979269 RepID=A0A437M140_9PROT|nr:hypothetical protein [Rhodovarius crocodyli]RVT91440.1 hypothetical protein EOD42_22555 [Rhodovarius crocodyli]
MTVWLLVYFIAAGSGRPELLGSHAEYRTMAACTEMVRVLGADAGGRIRMARGAYVFECEAAHG